ncbi:MAG: beta(1,3)galactosyltransferase EpsH [Lachnospiraceae bacterium]|nr:PssE/Cps14G family polysaccharide biosynthesis glycosyltransferase [uncultured Acetatifactor sp.]MCI8544544.1 beta(1,3)galactosyltransferase EpsH [Lachnospiraceae bacterium]
MIFVTVGSQKFQFNRLLEAIDSLCAERRIEEEVFAQTGYSDYEPKHYTYRHFLNRQEFAQVTNRADIVITHGGTGSIIGAIKKGKKVIAIPRLAKYQEHVDDHQLQLLEQFAEMNLIQACLECDKLANAIDEARKKEFGSYISKQEAIIGSIERFIETL